VTMARTFRSDSPVDCRAAGRAPPLPYEASTGCRGHEPRHPLRSAPGHSPSIQGIATPVCALARDDLIFSVGGSQGGFGPARDDHDPLGDCISSSLLL